MKINDENIELYLFRYKEGMLNAAEVAEVEKVLADNPEWQELADLYDPSLTLPAGATMEYVDCEKLRDGGQKSEQAHVILNSQTTRRKTMPLWISFAAAACLLLFVTTITKFMSNPESDNVTVAGNDKKTTIPFENKEDTLHNTIENPIYTYKDVDHNDEPLLIADASSTLLSMDFADDMTKTELVSVDTSILNPDNEPIRETEPIQENNNPMSQEVFYVNVINWDTSDNKPAEPVTRREQLYSIALRTTSIIASATASRNERRNRIEELLEEKIQSNQLMNSLIAAIK
ncbi:MAG: hypothetical protein J5848_00310 [Bacteroidales bacterium]|nr:hypothetical protein [Bacteroidales bacterium]